MQSTPNENAPVGAQSGGAASSRRQLLGSAIAISITSALFAGRARGATAGAPGSSAGAEPIAGSALDTLVTLAAGTSPSVYPVAAPKLRVGQLLSGGSSSLSILALNAAIDVIENLTNAGIATLGPNFFQQMILTDAASYQSALLALDPDAKQVVDYLASVGIPQSELTAVLANPNLVAITRGGQLLPGLGGLNAARIASLRASVPGYVANMPEKCAVTVIGAAVGGAAAQGLIDGSFDEGTALGAAFVGFAACGVGLSLMP